MFRRTLYILFTFSVAVIFSLGSINALAQETKSESDDITGQDLLPLGNPAADLDQCANGGVGAPPVICTGSAWQNGNLSQNQAHYLEGQAVPYRLRFSNLTIGSVYTVTIEWDTTENSGGKHALDCLTGYDMSETTADPCSGVAGCDLTVKDEYAIPPDANFTAGADGIAGTADDIPAMPGNFTLFSGDITGVSEYTVSGTYSNGSQTRITLTFTADAPNPVLAWGGHISTRMNWGVNHSAIAISGAPFHMRLIDLNGSGGNQDRSLSSAATIFPGKITIIKDARPNTSQIFGFTAAGPGVSNFTLIDNGTNAENSLNFENLVDFGALNTVTITENMPAGYYSLTQINCVEDPQGGQGQPNSTVNLPGRFASLVLEEGEAITCTYVNAVPTAATATIDGQILNSQEMSIRNAVISVTNLATGEIRSTRSNTFGYYQFANLPVGQTYLIQVRAKGYAFENNSILVFLMDDMAGVNFQTSR